MRHRSRSRVIPVPARYVLLAVAAVAVAACAREPRVREYDEVVIKRSPVEAAFDGSGAAAAAPAPLVWQTPPAWQELPGDGIRLAAFRYEQGDRRVETTVVMLGGIAGGVEANVVRWLDQIGLQLTGDELAQFLAGGEQITTGDGMPLTMYDFTRLASTGGDSILAAVGPVGEQTLFVKMSGHESLVAAARTDFMSLVESLGVVGGGTS
ncbi:MAG: hypothetical protein OXC12_20660 [Spirochaetaceae bacterium]|nr:hypothetical protein [Spirochaetaceae bacterium]